MRSESISLRELLLHRIEKHGPISFKDFMALSLYEEKVGYYSQEEIRIGKHGDFVTAPHTSKLFGYLLAVQIRQFFGEMPYGNEAICIAEFGAGTGVLAGDILEYFDRFHSNDFKSLNYIIIEPIGKRRKVLSEALSGYGEHVHIVSDLSEWGKFKGIVVANELFDAFPVHLLEKRDGKFLEIFVDKNDRGELVEKAFDIRNDELERYVITYLSDLRDGYRTEVNLEIKKWIADLSSVMTTGFCLIIDYGYSRSEYYADFRNRGTLLGYRNQNITEEFLKFPGLMDMTAHVNFSDVRLWFEKKGFRSEGFCPQWAFLGGLDIEQTMERAFGKLDPFSPVLSSVKPLIFPQGMGESHKVFVTSKGLKADIELKGFQMKNDIERLR